VYKAVSPNGGMAAIPGLDQYGEQFPSVVTFEP